VALVVGACNLHGGVAVAGGEVDLLGVLERLRADVAVLPEAWCPADWASPLTGLPVAARADLDVGHHWWQPFGRGWRWTDRRPNRRGRRRPPVLVDGPPDRPPARGPAPGGAEPGTVGLLVVSRWPARRVEAVDLGRLPRDRVRRFALVVELETPAGPVPVVGTHLAHLSQGSPWQFRRLGRLLDEQPDGVVLAGDLNLFGPLVERLLPGYRRGVRGRTWPATRPVAQPDHLLVRWPGPWVVRAGRVLAPVGSDHRPLRAVLVPRP
jgi:endonuclease/exonuclease/phosphatase family metal-dependent hydrolase